VREACAEFEEQIRKTWSRNPGEGRLQAAGLTSGCCCKKAGQQEMWSSFADFQASVEVLILYSNNTYVQSFRLKFSSVHLISKNDMAAETTVISL
jgi:hypothetical protein